MSNKDQRGGSQTAPQYITQALDERLGPIEDLLKSLSKPASASGMSPEAFLARAVGGNTDGVALIDPRSGQAKQLRRQDVMTRGIGWGPMLKAMFDVQQPGRSLESVEKSRRTLADEYKVVPVEMKAALAEGSGVTGGYVVPPQFSQQLQQLAIEDSIVERRASKQPMSSLTLTVPSLDYTTAQGAGNSPFLAGVVAKWTSEGATRDEAEPAFRQTELKAWELSLYSVASNNLLADNAVGLDSLLTKLFSMAIAWYTDYAYLQGNGVGKPLGVINAPATLGVNRTATGYLVYADLANMLSRLLPQSWGKSVWVAHQSLLPDLLRMNDQRGNSTNIGAGQLVWVDHQGGAAQQFPASLFGMPLMFSEKVPYRGSKGDIGLYDFSLYLLGKRMELEIAVSPHVKFLNNQTVWRVVWRGDGKPWINNSVTLADGTHTVSPFVVLNA